MKMDMQSQIVNEVIKMQKFFAKMVMEMEKHQTGDSLQIQFQMATFFMDVLKYKSIKKQLINYKMCANKTSWQQFKFTNLIKHNFLFQCSHFIFKIYVCYIIG